MSDGQDPLVIRSLEFLGPMATVDGWRPTSGLPEVAFAGRSNVGKSSLLNRLVRRKAFARVSNTPGRTREINFFEVNQQFGDTLPNVLLEDRDDLDWYSAVRLNGSLQPLFNVGAI